MTFEKNLMGDLKFHQASVRMKSQNRLNYPLQTNWHSRILEIVGIFKSLWSMRLVLLLKGKVEPVEWVGKPWPLPTTTWSGPSKGAHYWIFSTLEVTWWEAPESGYQLLDEPAVEPIVMARGLQEAIGLNVDIGWVYWGSVIWGRAPQITWGCCCCIVCIGWGIVCWAKVVAAGICWGTGACINR